MKTLISILIAMAFSSPAFAAKWKDLPQDLSTYKSLINKLPSLETSTSQMVYKKESEPIINSFKQRIYQEMAELGGHSLPKHVELHKVEAKDVRNKANFLLDDPSYYDRLDYEVGLPLSELNAIDAYAQKSNVETYMGGHGNSFGNCAVVIFFKPKGGQTLMLSACDGE